MTENKAKDNPEQLALELGDTPTSPKGSAAPGGSQLKRRLKLKDEEPATPLMKTVAARAPNLKNMKKVFSEEEVAEILGRAGETAEAEIKSELSKAERTRRRELYRKIKRQVKEMEKGNQSRLIVFPSLINGDEWYKLIEFSALYYVYRLAERMGRGARILKDTDKFSKAIHTASLVNIEKFVEQFERFEGSRPEITEDGIYIFTLKRPATDDEVGALRRTEETRREKLHSVVKPKAMDPQIYQAILMVSRQVVPRARKMDKLHYVTIGEDMVRGIKDLMRIYFNFAEGIISRGEAGNLLMDKVNDLLAGISLLSETRAWGYDVSTVIGENINEVKRLIIRDFSSKVKKTEPDRSE